nr:stage II sporulation protein R [Sedimentibacter sp.]
MTYSKKVTLSLFLVLTVILISYTVEAYGSIYQIKDKVIRLHVIANSDTFDDQQLKYKVRNNIIKTFDKEFEFITTKKESEKIILKELDEIREIAESTVKAEGYDYNINVYYGNYKFPRKQYEDIVLPEGNYDAVKIEIGKAQGKNWWCVMFPSLCFVNFGNADDSEPVFDIDTEKKLQEVLTQEEIDSIKTKRGLNDIKLKSRIFELIEKGKIENVGLYSDNNQRTYATSLSSNK